MSWILNLFPSFRALEALQKETARDLQKAQDEVVWYRNLCSQIQDRLDKALSDQIRREREIAEGLRPRTRMVEEEPLPEAPKEDPAKKWQAEQYEKFFAKLDEMGSGTKAQ